MKRIALFCTLLVTLLSMSACTQTTNTTNDTNSTKAPPVEETNTNNDTTTDNLKDMDTTKETTATTDTKTADTNVASDEETTDGYIIIKEGTGEEAKVGDTVSMHYVGTLEDGTQFDSSRDRGTPFQFTLGRGTVIPGWEEGIPGMKVGEVRKLIIPPEKGYGAAGRGPIPPNSTLIFEVELLKIL